MHLIDNWRDWWRFWSVRLQLLAASLLTILEAFPDAVLSALAVLPADVRALIDPEHIRYLGYACIAAGVVARIIRQPKLAERAAAEDRHDGLGGEGVADLPRSDRLDG